MAASVWPALSALVKAPALDPTSSEESALDPMATSDWPSLSTVDLTAASLWPALSALVKAPALDPTSSEESALGGAECGMLLAYSAYGPLLPVPAIGANAALMGAEEYDTNP
eukprot:6523003-Pyramimonas_sp.AAC.1